ncbi:YrdB family protein [Paenibacillus sp. D2_2]|uniref:YrdB family protein n=1 Tax=Paenibacillus sp. D2_2 TaxID=3073092 RepID=UPI002814BEC3|nr:YrdB family protein [Paenibacillus sp. D2_2]WMT43557.1 YrdB family protein [Paenibacillus sp. D2_2]
MAWLGRKYFMLNVINLTLRFLLELMILFSLGYWGFHFDSEIIIQIVLGIGLPLITAIIWGKIISPKATIKLQIIGGRYDGYA